MAENEYLIKIDAIKRLSELVAEAEVVKDETEELITNGGAATKQEVKSVNSQLEEVETVKMIEKNNLSKSNCKVCIVTDDGAEKDFSLWFKQIFEPENVPASTCVVVGNIQYPNPSYWMSWGQVEQLKENGWTVASHGYRHLPATEGVTEEELDYDYRTAQKELIKRKMDWDIFIIPEGKDSSLQRKVARRYYNYAVDTGLGNTLEETSDGLIDNYKIVRRTFMDNNRSLQDMKNDVDFCIKNDLTLIWMGHSHFPYWTTNPNAVSETRELIQYIKSKKIPIVNLETALKGIGNIVDIGDREVESADWVRISRDGKVNGSTFNYFKYPTTGALSTKKYLKIATIELNNESSCGGMNLDIIDIEHSGTEKASIFFKATYNKNDTSQIDLQLNSDSTLIKKENFVAYVTKKTDNELTTVLYMNTDSSYRTFAIRKKDVFLFGYNTKAYININSKYTDDVENNLGYKNCEVGFLGFKELADKTKELVSSDGDVKISTGSDKRIILNGSSFTKSLTPSTGGTHNIGDPVLGFYKNAYFSGFVKIPIASVAGRPSDAVNGAIVRDEVSKKIISFDNGKWYDAMGTQL